MTKSWSGRRRPTSNARTEARRSWQPTQLILTLTYLYSRLLYLPSPVSRPSASPLPLAGQLPRDPLRRAHPRDYINTGSSPDATKNTAKMMKIWSMVGHYPSGTASAGSYDSKG
ncbi:hypothetical protein IG631_05159 [Alternaria alternata]|nr:hypothetical protein IG631_05159 [Alternaria alternata]